MKRIVVGCLIITAAISPLFRGLFFPYETWLFLTVVAVLSVIYFLIKLACNEPVYFNKQLTAFGILLIAAYVLSFINAANIRENISAVIRYSLLFVVGSILYDYYSGIKKHFAVSVMVPAVVAGFVSAVIGIEALTKAFEPLNVTLNSGGTRIGGTLQYANTAAVYYLLCLLLSVTLVHLLKKPASRILFAGIGNTLFLALLLTQSRGGYIVGAIAMLFLIAFQPSGYKVGTLGDMLCIIIPALLTFTRISELAGSKDYIALTKYLIVSFLAAMLLEGIRMLVSGYAVGKGISPSVKGVVYFLSAVTVLVALFVVSAVAGLDKIMPQNVVKRFSKLGLNDRNVYVRIECMKDALKLISDNWLFGLGGGGWTSLYHSVQEEFYTSRAVHNHYLEVFVESGVLGFLSFAGLVICALVFWIRVLTRSGHADEKTVAVGFLCAFLALMIHSSFDFDLNYVSMALLLWLMIYASAIFVHSAQKDSVRSASQFSGGKAAKLAGAVFCSVILTLCGTYSVASWHANKGLGYMHSGDIARARVQYEKARSMDRLNPKYAFELAKIYNHYADKTADTGKAEKWRTLAIQASEDGMHLDRYYPAYREMAVRTYLKAGMAVKASETAEELVAYQPYKDSNYELLAKSCLEAGNTLVKNGETERAKALLGKCTQVEDRPDKNVSKNIEEYRKEAAQLLAQLK